MKNPNYMMDAVSQIDVLLKMDSKTIDTAFVHCGYGALTERDWAMVRAGYAQALITAYTALQPKQGAIRN